MYHSVPLEEAIPPTLLCILLLFLLAPIFLLLDAALKGSAESPIELPNLRLLRLELTTIFLFGFGTKLHTAVFFNSFFGSVFGLIAECHSSPKCLNFLHFFPREC